MPEIQVNGSRLHGHDVQIAVSTLLDGGTWLRPLRGDMIRLPVPDTQVRILISTKNPFHIRQTLAGDFLDSPFGKKSQPVN